MKLGKMEKIVEVGYLVIIAICIACIGLTISHALSESSHNKTDSHIRLGIGIDTSTGKAVPGIGVGSINLKKL